MESLLPQFQSYLKIERQVRPDTVRFYTEYYKSFFAIPWVDLYIFCEQDRFDKVWGYIMGKDITNNTKKKYLIFMRIFCDFLIYKKLVSVNFARDKKNPKVQQRLPFSLSEEDIPRIYDAIYRRWGETSLWERNRLIFDTFIYTWLRRWELSKLRKEDVYEDRIVVKEWKWGKPRIVFIPKAFGRKLLKWSESCGEYLFTTSNNHSLSDRTYLGIFQVISKELWIKVYPHLLRHTFASFSILSGIDIYTLQTQMWHESVEVTSKYLYVNDKKRAEQSQKLCFEF